MANNHFQVWQELNERQQNYLKIIYQYDQIAEENERERWRWRMPKRPASEWRWLIFDTVGSKLNLARDPNLKAAMKREGLIDEGTGSTFNALETRKLIECREDFTKRGAFLAEVQLTKFGRAVARAGCGEKPPKRRTLGQLRERQWAALVAAWIAGDEGVKKDDCLNYGGFSWEWTWLRLRDYYDAGRGLIKEREGFGHHSHIYKYDICITEAGQQYYRENWERYQELYPDVDAPPPDQTLVSNSHQRRENTDDGKERRKLNLKPFEGKWKHGPTRTIRVPIALADEILAFARRLDSGESLDTTELAVLKAELEALKAERGSNSAEKLKKKGQQQTDA
jgi:hypothetical protein